jgi:signal transduction histidine kinase
MLREIERVEWVVKGLLDLVRPDELHLTPGKINDVVRDTLRLTEAQLVHRKIAITEQLDDALPTVRLDADRLTQAVLNLVLNAADAMPNGGTLRIATHLDGSGAMVTLEICDDGVGIAAELRDKVFEPFYSTKREGVGLGLMNARNIVERHGGTLRLMARDGGGTCAVITLPADVQGRSPHLSAELAQQI